MAMKEKYVEVGFIYHFLLQRIIDISPGKSLEGKPMIKLSLYFSCHTHFINNS